MSCLLAVCLTIGVTANSYDDIKPSYAYHVTAGDEVYGWLSYESPTVRMLGQALSEATMHSAGIGFRYKVKKFSAFLEAGYTVLDNEPNEIIMHEVIYTQLVSNHHVGSRTIPVKQDYRTSYDLEDGYMGRVGVGYQHKHWKITAAYRVLSVREHYELWDEASRAKGGGWWEESHGRDLSAFELGVHYEF